jgi:hypothetical protein
MEVLSPWWSATGCQQERGSLNSVRSSLQRVGELQEQAAVSHHLLARPETAQDLGLSILAVADFHRSLAELFGLIRLVGLARLAWTART